MRVYAVDDERLMLEALAESIREVLPDAELREFQGPWGVLEANLKSPCDIAFLDINMPEISGIELARRLTAQRGSTNIVFVTGYDEYKADAMDVYASDYLEKPVTPDLIRRALSHLRNPKKIAHQYRAIMFGNFALYVDGKPVAFRLRKSAELLACLVENRGTVVPRQDLTFALFEDETHSRSSQKRLDNAVRALAEDLESADAAELLIRTSGGLAINRELLDADFYEWLEGNKGLFQGRYLEQYSWGEDMKARMSSVVEGSIVPLRPL